MICPNVNSSEWKALLAKNNNDKAQTLKDWLSNNQLSDETKISISDDTAFIASKIKEVFPNIPIVYDNTLNVAGKAVNNNGEISIIINPDLMKDDTIPHEFGHIFLDTIGGLENTVVKQVLQILENTSRAKEIRKLYSDKSKEIQDKEIVIDALGKDVVKLVNEVENGNVITRLIRGLLNQIADFFNLKHNDIRTLSNQMLNSQFKKSELVLNELQYEQKVNDKKSPEELKKDNLINKILVDLENRIRSIKHDIDTKGHTLEKSTVLSSFENVVKRLKSTEADKAIGNFLKLGLKNTENVLKEIEKLKGKNDLSLSDLYRVKSYVDSYNDSITSSIREIFENLNSEEKQFLNGIQNNFNEIESQYHRLAFQAIKQTIKPSFQGIYAFYKRKAIIEFDKYAKDNGLDKKSNDYNNKKASFIDNYLKDNQDVIQEEINLKSSKFLTTIDRDISFLDYWATNPRDLNNDVIQEAIKILDEADYRTNMQSDEYLLEAKYYYDRYVDYVGKKGNQKDLYAPILQVDDDGNVLHTLRFSEENAKREIFSDSVIEFEEEGFTSRRINNNKENAVLDDKYKGTPVEELLLFLEKSAGFRDKNIPKKYRLGKNLPIIEKDNLERLYESGPIAMLKGAIGDNVKVRSTDTDTGSLENDENLKDSTNYLDKKIKTLVDGNLKERQFIPIHYRNKSLEEDKRSFDVMSLFVLDMHQTFNYSNKLDVHANLMVMKDLLGRKGTEVNKTFGINKLAKVVLGHEKVNVSDSATESYVYKALTDLIEVRLYGIKAKGDPRTVKIIQSLKNYVSLSLLTNNWVSGAANYIQGSAMNIVKAAGGTDFNLSDYAKAKAKVTKDLPNITSDIARFHHKSKTNLLLRMLNVRSDFNPLMNKFSDDNLLKRKASPFSFLYYNEMAEFNIQASNMYATMNNIKVKNKNGKYIDKNGKEVEDKKNAMTIDEAFEAVYTDIKSGETITEEKYNSLPTNEQDNYTDAKLQLNPNVVSADRIGDVDSKGFIKLSKRLREINRSSFGNYDGNNRAAIDRTTAGPLFTHMRQWFVPLLKDRMLGGFTLFKFETNEQGKKRLKFIERKDLRPEDIKYNENLDTLQEGFYVTFMRYLGESLFKLKFNAITQNWSSLDEYEKSNIKKAMSELTMMISFVIVGNILANLKAESDDEDEKRRLLIASILVNRAASELMTFYNPMEWQKVMRSPAVSLGVTANITKAFKQLIIGPTQEFKTGKFKGENKAKVYFIRSTPFKSMYKDLDSIHNWVTN